MPAFQSIKGTFDVLPYGGLGAGPQSVSSEAWLSTESAIRSVCERFDFDEIRTPIIEPAELIARSIGEHTDIVTKEMFAFSRGDDHYVLRPELTAPVIRAVLQHSLQQSRDVHRLFYIGPCFRAERPQKGRYRQFHQFGCEIIGADAPVADVDVILCMVAIYRELGLSGFRLRMNSLGNPETRADYARSLQSYFSKFEEDLSKTSRTRLRENPLRLLDTKIEHELALLSSAPLITDFLTADDRSHFEEVTSRLDDSGVAYTIDPFLVRGLDYYTRTAFELEIDTVGAQNALAGGGRYDLLAEEIGAKTSLPAVGFAAGFERLFLALEAVGQDLATVPAPDVYFVSLGADTQMKCYGMIREARESGLRAAYDPRGRSMKAQLRDANKRGAPFVVIVGENELAAGKAQIKNMATGSELTVRFVELVGRLKELTDVPETA